MSAFIGHAGPWTSLSTPLTPWILDKIRDLGLSEMTPVQASTIPLFMKNKDVIVEAVTGSGKTLAFVVPILERLIRREGKLRKNEIGALVLSPTRELATQIHSIFSLFLAAPQREDVLTSEIPIPKCDHHPPPLLIVASAQSTPSQDLQRFLSTGADIVVGTPGRIEEFILRKGKDIVSTRELEVLVLDEADRLLDLGFQKTLTSIMNHLPKQRRTGLFSATMTDTNGFTDLIRVGLRNPASVVVKVQSKKLLQSADGKTNLGEVIQERRIPAGLDNFYLQCHASEKTFQLGRIISYEVKSHGASQFIIYFATCACVDYFFKILPYVLPLSATLHSLHGNIPPGARTRTLSAFSSASTLPLVPSILLATDVAARGLDLPHVDVVIQFDAPSDPRTFSHRCGRTARAGRSGKAWVLLVGREVEYVEFLAIRKIPLKEHPPLEESNGYVVHDQNGTENPELRKIIESIRTFVMSDRAVHDKATKAFVSFVRAYSKHEASYIFCLRNLDLVGIAKAFALLRLPRMPELKKLNQAGWEDAEIDWDAFSYVNVTQERKRLATIANQLKKEPVNLKQKRIEQRKNNSAWSKKADRKVEQEQRREKKNRKRKWLTAIKEVTDREQNPDFIIDRKLEKDFDDWDDLAREERIVKKLKKGKIDQEAFDAEFGIVGL